MVTGRPATPLAAAGPFSAVTTRSGRNGVMVTTEAAVTPLFASSSSVTTLALSMRAETKYVPGAKPTGTVTGATNVLLALTPSPATFRRPTAVPAPGAASVDDMKYVTRKPVTATSP